MGNTQHAPSSAARVSAFERKLRRVGALNALRTATTAERGDRAIVLLACARSGYCLLHASDALRADRECALLAVRQSGGALQSVAPELRDDTEIVREACREDGRALCWASKRLRGDPKIVVEAATQCVDALKYCYADDDEALWRDIMLKCVAVNGLSLRHAVRRGETFCTDKEIVVAACKEDGLALAFAPAMLQTDAECVLAAVQRNGMALEHASADLASDLVVVRSAVRNCGAALAFAGPCARSCGDIVIEAVARYAPALQWAAPELRSDVWFLVRCVAASASCACLRWASEELACGRRVRVRVNARLQTHWTFCSTFLLGTIQSPSASMLSVLGGSCHAGAKHRVALFLDIPLSEEVRVLRAAARSLFHPPSRREQERE
jgi:hypothetical protein